MPKKRSTALTSGILIRSVTIEKERHMELRTLGNSGLLVSEIGLGCNNFGGMIEEMDLTRSREVIDSAIDSGITFFDTSDSYGTEGGSEEVLGEVLGKRRQDIVLATKFASP